MSASRSYAPLSADERMAITEAAADVREALGLRGRDAAGHRVYVHRGRFRDLSSGSTYIGTIVYEGRGWTADFEDRVAALEPEWSALCEVEALSSYEIGLVWRGPS